jgi:hypothetical protein
VARALDWALNPSDEAGHFLAIADASRTYFLEIAQTYGRDDFLPGASLAEQWRELIGSGPSTEDAIRFYASVEHAIAQGHHSGASGPFQLRTSVLEWAARAAQAAATRMRPELSTQAAAALRARFITLEGAASDGARLCERWLALTHSGTHEQRSDLWAQVAANPRAKTVAWVGFPDLLAACLGVSSARAGGD